MVEPYDSFLRRLQFFSVLNDQRERHVIVSTSAAKINRNFHLRNVKQYFHLILFILKGRKREHRSRNESYDVEGSQIPDRNILQDSAFQGAFICRSMEFR